MIYIGLNKAIYKTKDNANTVPAFAPKRNPEYSGHSDWVPTTTIHQREENKH